MAVDAHCGGYNGLDARAAAKLIGILSRLGSPYEGERAAAGLLANAFVARHGLQWQDIVGMLKPVPEPSSGPDVARIRPERRRGVAGWRGYCRRRHVAAGQIFDLVT